ncbi:YbaK/EbsC family protein [Miniphocaeibacter massiliensis]|uniref:YbaK/EbsC family protein n=1 Tax=Miniphocaeibacter massiliensis TaxID=2041841 RepID=UPI000C080621|nr:YbaK/EbsC family protein [Miniphocaeibacter massiliensis]
MSFENAKLHIEKYNLENNIVIHKELIATVELAAEQIGCSEAQIAKSLTFKVNDEPVMVVLAGDKKIDNKKFKDFFNTKAKMLKAEEAVELVGHEVGGVCPFGIKEEVKVYLDNSLKEHKIVYPACGSKDSSIKLTIDELETVSNSISWIDISK